MATLLTQPGILGSHSTNEIRELLRKGRINLTLHFDSTSPPSKFNYAVAPCSANFSPYSSAFGHVHQPKHPFRRFKNSSELPFALPPASEAFDSSNDDLEPNPAASQVSALPFFRRGIPMLEFREEVRRFLSPIRVGYWLLILALTAGALRLTLWLTTSFLLRPTLLMHASWFLASWMWPVAAAIGFWTACVFVRKGSGQAGEWEQGSGLAGALTWLILVPCGHFQGYVDGWPLFLFFFYLLFFSVSSFVRFRMHRELGKMKGVPEEWKTHTNPILQTAFVASIVSGHWMAAKQALNLHTNLPFSNPAAILVLLIALMLHWDATYYLAKYSDESMVPKAVVSFGPYRFIRHPIYLSYILLFLGYSLAFKSYASAAFMLAASSLYYWHKISLEESVMLKNFAGYLRYIDTVKHKLIPNIL